MELEWSRANLARIVDETVLPFLVNLGVAIAILVVGRWIARMITRTFRRHAGKRLDPSLVRFISSMLNALLLTIVVIAALDRVGVKTTAAIAVLGAAGLAVGLALQGSLANFAAGVLLIVFRPLRVDDLVTIAGHTGIVEEIAVFTTTLRTPDNRTIIIPNGQVTSGSIVNLTVKGALRIDLIVGVSYRDDLKKARAVLERVLAEDPRILADPAPQVAVSELGESSVNFVVRPWVKVADYWDVRFATTERVKEALDAAQLTIPFPQRDVHLHETAARAGAA